MSQDEKYPNNEIKHLDDQINLVEAEVGKLQRKLNNLKSKKQELEKQYNLSRSFDKKSEALYSGTEFPWSSKVQNLLEDVFKLKAFRLAQLITINATLSKKDLLLLMPTGGGKSICYQLPALVGHGMTLVVSPLLSLIENQQIALGKLNILAKTINSSTSKDEKKKIYEYLSRGTKPIIKLLYVTPEWLSKSKMFKSYLQKCHGLGNLDRIAIDEVHCCSQWGHDFRTDYQFLSLLKDIFFNVPIIGVTATATVSVLLDVQKMLNISGCLIFKSSVNRPNLFYKVVPKATENTECINYIESLLKNDFKDQSGIIYAFSIRDTEELSQALRSRRIRVRPYHANLDADLRTKVHEKWLNNEYQAVVATVAFGMGIDKPDVRFVIHYSLPKSIESLYQESGRAGRDGKSAQCILMYRFSDYFRSSAVINSKTEETKLRSVLEYCLKSSMCRREFVALNCDEKWQPDDCDQMCDNCRTRPEVLLYNITPALRYVYSIIDKADKQEINLTLLKLIDAWFKAGDKNLRVETIEQPKVERCHVETIIAYLLVKGYLSDYKSYTAYATNCYIKKGRGCHLSADTRIEMPMSASVNIRGLSKRSSSLVDLEENLEMKRVRLK